MGEWPYGRVLRGIRVNGVACPVLSKDVFTYKLTVFAVPAALAGLAGAIFVTQTHLAVLVLEQNIGQALRVADRA